MFPKIQRSRQAGWPRFWRRAARPGHGPWASRSRCAFPSLDHACWKRCDESIQTSFTLPPHPLSHLYPFNYTDPDHRTLFVFWKVSPYSLFPLFNGIPCISSPLCCHWPHHLSSSAVFSFSLISEITLRWYFSVQTSGKDENWEAFASASY